MSERPERKERSEKEMKQRSKPGPKTMDSDVYDVHFSMRMSPLHAEIVDRVRKRSGASRGEVIREMIREFGKRMEERGII